jgi:hypothetical protein
MNVVHDIANKINSMAMKPLKGIAHSTLGNPPDLPRWGDVIPFMGCCCFVHSCYVSVRGVLHSLAHYFSSSKAPTAFLVQTNLIFVAFVNRR